MPNGSLDSHLFQKKSAVLDWKTRYQIALGTAKGLDYLHEKCRHCIIHCDIKPAIVLLDAELADFGMAKLIGHKFSKVLILMKGSIGYLTPERIAGLPMTAEADVYSYGMLLLEIISGKQNANHYQDGTIVLFLSGLQVSLTKAIAVWKVMLTLMNLIEHAELLVCAFRSMRLFAHQWGRLFRL
eukprot:TRINITY_DN7963_c0_g1_i2.p1 TRINITY_DN7963_c0_g1~~TRINITY_DN7963_c0_g1_i2.p1  ORF type:complete len:184 (+),score=26.24 TRINITY_DN7963_c0_g1_i2:165-716(+)